VDLPVAVAILFEDVLQEHQLGLLSKSWKPLIGSLKRFGHDSRSLDDAVPHP
jgi:hypothetical protein